MPSGQELFQNPLSLSMCLANRRSHEAACSPTRSPSHFDRNPNPAERVDSQQTAEHNHDDDNDVASYQRLEVDFLISRFRQHSLIFSRASNQQFLHANTAMGSVSYVSARRLSSIVELRIKRRYRRQSPGGAQRSLSVSGDDENYRMGLKRSRRDGPYDSVDNFPTASIALYPRSRYGFAREEPPYSAPCEHVCALEMERIAELGAKRRNAEVRSQDNSTSGRNARYYAVIDAEPESHHGVDGCLPASFLHCVAVRHWLHLNSTALNHDDQMDTYEWMKMKEKQFGPEDVRLRHLGRAMATPLGLQSFDEGEGTSCYYASVAS